MHDDAVSYYRFDRPKIELEVLAYAALSKQRIRIPAMIEYNLENRYLIKEYIEGKTIVEMLVERKVDDRYILEMLEWERELKKSDINIDYYPNNFVIRNNEIFYIDYECNKFNEEWSFRNWGIYYWINRKGFIEFARTKDSRYINYEGTGIPVKK